MGQSLTVDVGARTTSFEEGMRRAADVANKQMSSIGRSIDGIGGQLSSVADKFAKFTGILAGLGAGMSFTGMIKGAIDAADRFDDLAQSTGIAHEALSGYAYSAKLSGTDLEGVASSVGKLSKNMAAAASGSAQQSAAFGAIGVAVKNADGSLKSADQMLGELSDKFKGYADGPAKAALAQELFGKSGAAMIPFLNQGSAAIAKQREEALKYSGVTKEVSRQASEFNDELDKIGLISSGVGTSIAATLLPAMKGISEVFVWLRDHSKEVNAGLIAVGATATVFALSTSKASGAVGILNTAMKTLGKTMLMNPFGLAATAIGAAAAALYYYRDATITVGDTTATVGDVMSGAWVKVKEGFTAVWDWIKNDLAKGEGDWRTFSGAVANTLSSVFGFIKDRINGVVSMFVALGGTFGIVAGALAEHFTNGFDRVRSLAVSFWDGIKKVFSGDLSFSAFSAEVSKDFAKASDVAGQIKDKFSDAFSTDYVGNFAAGVKTAIGGVVESLAIAGREAKKLNKELADGEGGNGDAPIVGAGAGAGFSKLAEGLDKQLAYAQAGYDALFKAVKVYVEREQDMLAHSRDMGLVSEQIFLEQRGTLQQQAAEANVKRIKDTYADLSAALEKVQATPAKTGEEANKQREKAIEIQTKMVKLTQELEEAEAGVGDVVRKTGQDMEKYHKSIADQVRKITEASSDYASSLKKRATDLQFETSLIGKSQSAQAKLRAERELRLEVDRKILEINREIADLERNGGDPAIIARRRQEITDIQQQAADAIKEIQNSLDVQDWTKTFDQINQSLTDAIMRGFEEGKSFAENFKDSLKNMFKTLILRPMIDMTVRGGMGMLGGLMSGGASAGTGGSGLLGFLGQGSGGGGGFDLGGTLQNVGNLFSNGAINSVGWLGAGASAIGLSGLGMGLSGATGAALAGGGGLAGAMSGASYMFAGGGIGAATAAGGIGAGFGAAMGAIAACAPYIAAVAAVVMALVSIFGKRGAPKAGGFAVSENLQGAGIDRYFTPNNADEEAAKTIGTIDKSWKGIAQSFGLASQGIGFGFGFDSDPGGTADNRTKAGVYFNGERIYFNQEDWGRDDEEFQEGIALEIQKMMLAAARAVSDGDLKTVLGDFDITKAAKEEIEQAFADATYWKFSVEPMRAALANTFGQAFSAQEILDLQNSGETLEQTMSRLNSVFSSTNLAARVVGQNVEQLFGKGFDGIDGREALASRFGSSDAMNSAMSYYAQNFRSPDASQWAMEDSGAALRSIFADIGEVVPRTREEFDRLVQGLDLTSSSAQETFTKLMNAAPAFNGLMGVIEDISKGMDAGIANMRRTLEMGGLDQNETYAYLKNEGDTAFASLQTATGIEDINKYFEQAMASMNQTFGTLDDEGKHNQRAAFLAQLDELEAVKNERIEAAKDMITGPADAIKFSGNAVAQALADIAGQLGVEIDIKPMLESVRDITDAASENVTATITDLSESLSTFIAAKPGDMGALFADMGTGFLDILKPALASVSADVGGIDMSTAIRDAFAGADINIDAEAADALSVALSNIKDVAPLIDTMNKKDVAAQEAASDKVLSAADEFKTAVGGMQTLMSMMQTALANIKVDARVTVESPEVGHAY